MSEAEESQLVKDLRAEIETLREENRDLEDDNDHLRSTVSDVEIELQIAREIYDDDPWKGRYRELVNAIGLELSSIDFETAHERTLWLARRKVGDAAA